MLPLLARRWWPVPALMALSFAAQKALFESRYDVSGHAAEHLSSATAPFAAAVLIGTLLFLTPQTIRPIRQPIVFIAMASWLASTVLVLVGNVRVVDALIQAGMAHTPTSQLIERGSVDSAHSLANLAPWFGVLAALALTVAFWHYEHVSRRVAIGAGVLNVIFPPWIIPGAGVFVLTIARGVAYQRTLKSEFAGRRS